MYPYQPLSGRDAAARQAQLWTTVLDYRYLAAPKLAADDLRERAQAEASLVLALKQAGIATGWTRLRDDLQHAIGAALVRCGEWLQGVPTAEPTANSLPAASN